MSCWRDKYFWRQLYILLSTLWVSLGMGFSLGYPSIVIPALTSPNATDIRITNDEASWFAAIMGIASIPGFIVLPMLMQRYGRKFITILISLLLLISWITFVLCENITTLFYARILQGFFYGSSLINMIAISEYSSPKRRGYFLMIKKTFISSGIMLCHLEALFLTWRQIAGFGIILGVLGSTMPLYWPESPMFLAFKRRFVECKRSFFWLHGKKNNSKELMDLLEAHRFKKNSKNSLKRYFEKDFLKAFFAVIFLLVLIESCGRHYFAAYIVQMMVQLTGDKSIATYITIGFDSISVIATFMSSFVIRRFKRRTILFSFGGTSTVFMFLISSLLYLKILFPSTNLDIAIVAIIMLFSLSTNIGVVPLSFGMMGEIFPLDLKGVGTSISGVTFACIFSVTLKIAPTMFASLGLSASFLIYAVCMVISLVVLYTILPETKDRTLQEIEYDMKGIPSPGAERKPMLGN